MQNFETFFKTLISDIRVKLNDEFDRNKKK